MRVDHVDQACLTFSLLSHADLNPNTWELPDVSTCGTSSRQELQDRVNPFRNASLWGLLAAGTNRVFTSNIAVLVIQHLILRSFLMDRVEFILFVCLHRENLGPEKKKSLTQLWFSSPHVKLKLREQRSVVTGLLGDIGET